MLRRPLRRGARPWLVLALVALATVRAGSVHPRPSDGGPPPWRVNQPVPIAVTGGRARFQVPSDGARTQVLVIVSTLAKGAGPYPIRLVARGATRALPPALADDGPSHPPELNASPLPPVAEPVLSRPAPTRPFHLLVREGDVASASNYLVVHGHLRAVGRRVQVYVDAQDVAAVGPEVLRDVVSTFDRQVFPEAARTIGQAQDVDRDGRFTILMSSWLSRLAGGRHAVDGFVRGADLDAVLAAPFSNHCDMMYLNAALKPGPHLRTVMAHEYTHAVIYTAKSVPGPSGGSLGGDEEGWLDEALAHLGEDLHGFSRSNVAYRISAFLSRPESYRLVVDDYYAADLFRSHGNRGGTYLFLRWCADRYGPALLPALVRSHRRGAENLEAATGVPFAALYRRWSTSLILGGLDAAHDHRDGFRSLDLRAPLDGWDLAGPRVSRVAAGGGTETWSGAGTSSRFVIVEGSPLGAVDVEVQAPAEAELQVTSIPLPAGLPALELRADASVGDDGTTRIVATIGERRGIPVRLSALAWEPLAPEADPRARGYRRGRLDPAGIAATFGTADVPAGGRIASRAIPLDSVKPGTGPFVLKAVGTDPLGRRVSAWAEIHPDGPLEERDLD